MSPGQFRLPAGKDPDQMPLSSHVLRVTVLSCGLLMAGSTLAQQPTANSAGQEGTPVSPRLMQILLKWEESSKTIETLSGNHHRIVYDLVFEVEKHADGRFFYEAPDKGRIDIEPSRIPKGAQGNRKNAQGKPFEMKADIEQKWICDGDRIIQLSEIEKTAEIFQIPPESRGQNIMNGPLPFLFGMPAKVALQRYELSIVQDLADRITLRAKPKWGPDAANWREAMIMLSPETFLPIAVQLTDPTGNAETVYSFQKLTKNRTEIPFLNALWTKWYAPDLKGYNIVNKVKAQPQPVAEQPLKPGEVRVPSLVGLSYKDAQTTLDRMGLKVKFLRGKQADDSKFVYRVYDQQPPPRTAMMKDGVVSLTLYDKPGDGKQVGDAGTRRQ